MSLAGPSFQAGQWLAVAVRAISQRSGGSRSAARRELSRIQSRKRTCVPHCAIETAVSAHFNNSVSKIQASTLAQPCGVKRTSFVPKFCNNSRVEARMPSNQKVAALKQR